MGEVSFPMGYFLGGRSQVFRFNNRSTKENPLDDADRFVLAMSQIVGKRLTFAELTGKVGETAF